MPLVAVVMESCLECLSEFNLFLESREELWDVAAPPPFSIVIVGVTF